MSAARGSPLLGVPSKPMCGLGSVTEAEVKVKDSTLWHNGTLSYIDRVYTTENLI